MSGQAVGRPSAGPAEYYNRALIAKARRDNVPAADVSVHHALMNHWSARGRRQLAAFHGKHVINGYQRIRQRIEDFDEQTRSGATWRRKNVFTGNWPISLIADGRAVFPEAQQVLRMLKEQEHFEIVRREAQGAQSPPDSSQSEIQPRHCGWRGIGRLPSIGSTALGRERGELAGKKTRSIEEDARLSRLEEDLVAAGEAFHAFLGRLAAEFGQSRDGGERLYQLRESQGLMGDAAGTGETEPLRCTHSSARTLIA